MTKRPKGLARSTSEMDFYISLQSCTECGKRMNPDKGFNLYGGQNAWTLTGPCSACGAPQGYPFVTSTTEPIHAESTYDTLGLGHSDIISARAFMEEILLLAPQLAADPTQLGLGVWEKNRDISNRLAICVNELAKFFSETEIPDARMKDADRDYRAAHPRYYQRPWIDALVAKQKQMDEAIIADVKRIDKLEAIHQRKKPKGIDWLERDAMQAHEKWVERGRKGKGRLVLVSAEHDAMNVGNGVELSGSVFFDVNMPVVRLANVKFHDAELTNTRFEGGGLSGGEFVGATINECSFRGAIMKHARFEGATIDGTDFSEANLHLSEWPGAQVTDTKFDDAIFGDANLDEAVFTGCSFAGADFSADDPDDPPTTGARFENCDLRNTKWEGRNRDGAEFVNCKLDGSGVH